MLGSRGHTKVGGQSVRSSRCYARVVARSRARTTVSRYLQARIGCSFVDLAQHGILWQLPVCCFTSAPVLDYWLGLLVWFAPAHQGRVHFWASTFTILTAVVFGSIQASNAFSFVPDISNAKTAAWDSIQLLDMVPEIDVTSDEVRCFTMWKVISSSKTFTLGILPDPPSACFVGLDIEVKPGTYVALVGCKLCGKSTTIQLIQRFYDTLSGKVTIEMVTISPT